MLTEQTASLLARGPKNPVSRWSGIFSPLATGDLEEGGMPLRTRGGKLTKLGHFEEEVKGSPRR